MAIVAIYYRVIRVMNVKGLQQEDREERKKEYSNTTLNSYYLTVTRALK